MPADMFLKLDGITGESTDATHAGEIQILQYSWGMRHQDVLHAPGRHSRATVEDMTFTKNVDRASTAMMMKLMEGTTIPEAILTCRKAGNVPVEYLKVTMKEVFITSISPDATEQTDEQTEEFSLNFESFVVKYTEQDKLGANMGSTEVKWNIALNRES